MWTRKVDFNEKNCSLLKKIISRESKEQKRKKIEEAGRRNNNPTS